MPSWSSFTFSLGGVIFVCILTGTWRNGVAVGSHVTHPHWAQLASKHIVAFCSSPIFFAGIDVHHIPKNNEKHVSEVILHSQLCTVNQFNLYDSEFADRTMFHIPWITLHSPMLVEKHLIYHSSRKWLVVEPPPSTISSLLGLVIPFL